jgi:hypothetical protein
LGEKQQEYTVISTAESSCIFPRFPNKVIGDGRCPQSLAILNKFERASSGDIAPAIQNRPQINVLTEKPPIQAPLGVFIYQFGRIQAEETRSGNRILRLREEEEQGDQESQADQTEERSSSHQGDLRLLWQANLQDWQAEVGLALPVPFYFQDLDHTASSKNC